MTAEPEWVGDCLVILVGEIGGELVWKEQARGSLEPDIEEVRKFGVRNVVVVGRVDENAVDASLFQLHSVGGSYRDPNGPVSSLGVEERPVVFRPSEANELIEGLAGLLDDPIETKSCDRWCHLGETPLESEVMPVKNTRDHFTICVPSYLDGVVIQHLVHGDRQIRQAGLVEIRDGSGIAHANFIDQLMKHLDAGAVSKQLAGREEVSPPTETVPVQRPAHRRLVAGQDPLYGQDIPRLPFGPLGLKGGLDQGGDVVLWAGGAEAPDGLDLVLAGLGHPGLDGLLVDDGVELLAHPASLGLSS